MYMVSLSLVYWLFQLSNIISFAKVEDHETNIFITWWASSGEFLFSFVYLNTPLNPYITPRDKIHCLQSLTIVTTQTIKTSTYDLGKGILWLTLNSKSNEHWKEFRYILKRW